MGSKSSLQRPSKRFDLCVGKTRTDSGTQTGHNKDEVAQLLKEHPDENELVKDGRFLGLGKYTSA